MVQGRESKEDEEGYIAAGQSFCLNNIRVVNWGIVLQESNHLWSAYHGLMDFRNFFRYIPVSDTISQEIHHHYSPLIPGVCP